MFRHFDTPDQINRHKIGRFIQVVERNRSNGSRHIRLQTINSMTYNAKAQKILNGVTFSASYVKH